MFRVQTVFLVLLTFLFLCDVGYSVKGDTVSPTKSPTIYLPYPAGYSTPVPTIDSDEKLPYVTPTSLPSLPTSKLML